MIVETKRKSMSAGNTKLIAAHLDFSNLRWQMIGGLLLASLAVVGVATFSVPDVSASDRSYVMWAKEAVLSAEQDHRFSLPMTQVSALLSGTAHMAESIEKSMQTGIPTSDPFSLLSLLLDFSIWRYAHFGFLLTNMLLLILCLVLVAMVALDVTGLFGNRAGGAAAIWAAALFAVNPSVPAITYSLADRQALFTCVFFLATIFFSFRFHLLKESGYRQLALVSVTLLASSFLSELLAVEHRDNSLPVHTLNSFLFSSISHESLNMSFLAVLYLIPPALYLLRLFFGGLKGGPMRNALRSAIFPALPVAMLLSWGNAPDLAIIVCSMAGFCILLPLLAFPTIDSGSRRDLVIFNGLGILSLSFIFLFWCAASREQSILLHVVSVR
jgi:hypothetical protein